MNEFPPMTAAPHRLDSAAALARLARSLLASDGPAQIYSAIEHCFVATFGMPVAILAPTDPPGVLHASPDFQTREEDLAVARAAMRERRIVDRRSRGGRTRCCVVPLLTFDGLVGALALRPGRRLLSFPTRDRSLVQCFADHAALALLRARWREEARNASTLRDTNQLYFTLLNSIAHSFRTPLTCIIGSLNTLEFEAEPLSPDFQREMLRGARIGAERLNRVIGSLLDISRLEGGGMSVRLDPCDVRDVIGASLEQLGLSASSRILTVVPPELPFVRMDFVLIVQVLVNLLDNAVKYSGPNSPIIVEARHSADALEFLVSDAGEGIPEGEMERVFEKFHRAGRGGESGGIGLGLAICKGLVEAHGGAIRAERRLPRGATIRFTIPCRGREAV